MSSQDDVRQKTTELVRQLQSNPAFAESVRADPQGALLAAGLPASRISHVLDQHLPEQEDVAGYMMPSTHTECDDEDCEED